MYMTKKVAVFTTFTLSTVGFTTYLLTNKHKRKRIFDRIKNVYGKIQFSKRGKYTENPEAITKLGHPHPHDIGDNTMVSEGSMYSVNYYNEKEHKDKT